MFSNHVDYKTTMFMRNDHLHGQLEENCEKPEAGKLWNSLAKVAQVAKV